VAGRANITCKQVWLLLMKSGCGKQQKLYSVSAEYLIYFSQYCVVFLISIGYLHHSGHYEISSSLLVSAVHAFLYLIIYYSVNNLHLYKLTLVYLLVPYAIFFALWLNSFVAFISLGIMLVVLSSVWKRYSLKGNPEMVKGTTGISFGLFILISVWVHLAGIGGYGFQTLDYEMHNGRLLDLINYSWPVSYSENQNLVFNIAYYLFPAIVGKISDYQTAQSVVYFMSILGVALVFCWLKTLIQTKSNIMLFGFFVVFGGMDILGYLSFSPKVAETFDLLVRDMSSSSDLLDFWLSDYLGFFWGSFSSNSFSLYWAPHQVIAGWLVSALLVDSIFKERIGQIGFHYALLALWSPMILLTLGIFILICFLLLPLGKKYMFFSWESLLGGGWILLILSFYYLGGAALSFPQGWVWEFVSIAELWPVFLLGWFLSFGVFFFLCLVDWKIMLLWERKVLVALGVTSMILLSYKFGEYNDLLCRGSSALYFVLFCLLGRRYIRAITDKDYNLVARVSIVVIIGSVSFWLATSRAIAFYGEKRQAVSVPDYYYSYQFLGPDNSFFLKYLAAGNSLARITENK